MQNHMDKNMKAEEKTGAVGFAGIESCQNYGPCLGTLDIKGRII